MELSSAYKENTLLWGLCQEWKGKVLAHAYLKKIIDT
jgi:hypothetical protein